MNCSSIRRVLTMTVFGLGLVAGRAEAQTCRGAEAMDRDHPYEVGALLEFGEGSSGLGGTATVGNTHEFAGATVERVSAGGAVFGSNSAASLRLQADAGAQVSARKGALALCPFVQVSHVGSRDGVDPQTKFGALSVGGGVNVGFSGPHSDDFRITPLIGGGVVQSRESQPTAHGANTVWATNGVVQVGLGLVRQDSTSFIVSYAVAFNSTLATSTFAIALNFAVGHK